MITMEQLNGLKIGAIVDYGFFSNLKYIGLSENKKEVWFQDKNGNKRSFLVSLVLKHSTIKVVN